MASAGRRLVEQTLSTCKRPKRAMILVVSSPVNVTLIGGGLYIAKSFTELLGGQAKFAAKSAQDRHLPCASLATFV